MSSSSARKLTFITTQRLQSPLILKRCVSSSSLIQRRDKSTVPSAATSRHPALEAAIDHAALFDSAHSYVRSPLSVSPAVFSHNSPIRPVRSDPPPSLKSVPVDGTITFPPYAQNGIVPPSLNPHRITLHNESSAQRMRVAGRLARRFLNLACSLAVPGVTTEIIDDIVHDAIISAGAYPSPLNYANFPKSLCSSINEVVCHGIPDGRMLRVGDIASFDVSCFVGGVHGDNCATVVVGEGCVGSWWEGRDKDISDDCGGNNNGEEQKFHSTEEKEVILSGRRLARAASEAVEAAIDECGPGRCLTSIGESISHVADAYGYGSVERYRGHGVGEEFHCAPFIRHYRNNDRLEMKPGMVFTIEPMLTEGDPDCIEWTCDGWTVVTRDGGRAAQFEHMVLITDNGCEVLTLSE